MPPTGPQRNLGEMAMRHIDEIDWDNELIEVTETDLDGHGTREGVVWGRWAVGGRYENYKAIGTSEYPYDHVEHIREADMVDAGRLVMEE